MSDWTSGSFSTSQQRASGLLGNVRSSGTSTPALDSGATYRAVRHVASMAEDAEECAEILAMLGLAAGMGKHEVEAA